MIRLQGVLQLPPGPPVPHLLRGEPAMCQKCDHPEMTVLRGCLSWPRGEAAWRETAVAATPSSGPSYGVRESSLTFKLREKPHGEDPGLREMAPAQLSQHLQPSERPQQRPWIVLPKFQSQNRKYTKMGVVLCHQVLRWFIRQPQITGALCDAKEGWLDPHSGSRRETRQPWHWDE